MNVQGAIHFILNKLKLMETVNTETDGVITPASGSTVRYDIFDERCGVVHARFAINRGGTAFTNGRVTLGTVSNDWLPVQNVMTAVSVSTSVNGYADRTARLILFDNGQLLLDNQGNTDVKEVNCSIVYLLN